MSKWVGSAVIALLCLEGIISSGADYYNTRLAHAEAELQPDHVAQELLISTAASDSYTLKATLKNLQSEYHLTAIERLPTSDQQFRVQFTNPVDLASIMAAQDPDLLVEPNYVMHASALPNDSYYASEQWYLHNSGQSFHHSSTVSLPGTPGIDINWQPAFDQTAVRGDGTIVAVIDSGVIMDHPDLAAHIWTNPADPTIDSIDNDANNLIDDVHGWNFVANNNNPTDDLGHGTLAAGFIGAIDDTHGVIGVAPHTRIMPLKVLDAQGNGTTANVIKAINYAVSHGANVINMSFGGMNAATAPLISACHDAQQAGVVLVAAAGNTNQNIENNAFAPASIDSVIAVGSIDSNGLKASFSNTGNKLSLVTPGVFMLNARSYSSHENSNTVLADGATAPDGYIIVSGTSFSTPLVSGAALLLHEQNPNWSPTQIQTQLENTARDLGAPGKDTQYGNGLLDIGKALGIAAPTPLPVINNPPTIDSITWNNSSISNDDQSSAVLTVTVSDPESDALTVTASGSTLNQDSISFTSNDGHIFVSPPIHTTLIAGTYVLTIHVSDGSHQVDQDTSLSVTQAPVALKITSPTTDSHIDTTDSSIVIGGTVEGPIQKIIINGTSLESFLPGQNSWSSTQTLNIGDNLFNVDGYTFNNRLLISTNITITRSILVTSSPEPSPSPSPTASNSNSPTPTPTPSTTPTTDPTTSASPAPITATPPPPVTTTTRKRSRVSSYTPTYIAPIVPFNDIPADHFASSQINDLHSKGSIRGVNNFYFPNNTISKGEFLKIALYDANLINTSCSQTTSPFLYAENSVFNQVIHCAYAYGLLSYEPSSFNPNQAISRSQAIVWLVSIRRTSLSQSPNSAFIDVATSSWSPYINTAYEHRWIQGIQGLFYPNNTLTRAEAAKVIVNSRS